MKNVLNDMNKNKVKLKIPILNLVSWVQFIEKKWPQLLKYRV